MGKQVIGGVFLAIIVSIFILNGTKTSAVIKQIGESITGFAGAVNGASGGSQRTG